MRDPDFTAERRADDGLPARCSPPQGKQITYHYDPAFIERFRRTERKLAELFLTKNDILLMQGEAVLGLEAAARGLVQPGTPGAQPRLRRLRQGHGLLAEGLRRRAARARGALQRLGRPGRGRAVPRRAPGDRPADRRPLGDAVRNAPRRRRRSARSAHEPRRARIVDCVSSLGGIEFRTDDWQIDIAVAAAQKCLGGPPGITLMTVSDAAWERIRANPARRARPSSPCSTGRSSGSTARSSRSRRPSSTCTASRRAVDDVLEEGLDASIARHDLCGRAPAARASRRWGSSSGRAARRSRAACVTAIAVPTA